MKLSVSVPDELWEAAKAQRPDLNPSHLIQEVLEDWQRRGNGLTSRPSRPPETDDQFNRVRNGLAVEVRAEFVRGYRAALVLVESTNWMVLSALAEVRFDVSAWAEMFASLATEAEGDLTSGFLHVVTAMTAAVGSLVPKYGEGAFRPTTTYHRGFVAAMRDLWNGASNDIDVAGPIST